MKNSSQKILLILLGVMILLLVCLGVGKIFYKENNVIKEKNENVEQNNNNNNKETEKIHEEKLINDKNYNIYGDITYVEDEEYNAIIFLKYNKSMKKYEKINKYYCENKQYCGINDVFEYKDYLIFDNSNNEFNNILYNYEKGILFKTDNFEDIGFISRDHGGKYFVLKNKDGKVGLIDIDGNVIVDYKYEEIGKYNEDYDAISEASFSLDKDFIRYKDNNKYGILRLSDGKVLLNANYDNLDFLYDSGNTNINYYKTFENNKWYLNSFNTFSKVINIGYDDILFASNILIVKEGKYLYIKDFTGKNLTEKNIELYVDDMKPCEIYRGGGFCPYPGFNGYFNDNKSVVNIQIMKNKECINKSEDPDKECFYKYEFNLENNSLTQL